MSWPLAQVAILVVMTHTVRAIADRLGPRWGALVLGMPSTTAVLLVGGAYETGADSAIRASESSLLGLVATAVLPLAYASAIRRRWGVPAAPLAAMGAYFLTAIALVAMPRFGFVGTTCLALLGVGTGCRLARRLPAIEGRPERRSTSRSLVLRSVVPAVFVLANRGLRELAGAGWSGTFTTFPAMSLAVLVSLHLESGRAPALRMARSMPRGNLLMIAFLVTFRALCESAGPLGAALAGYLAVMVTIAALHSRQRINEDESQSGLRGPIPIGPARVDRLDRWSAFAGPRVHRSIRPFAPGIEPIAA